MKLVFQIAAGVIIAILATNIVLMRSQQGSLEGAYQSAEHQKVLLNGANISQSMFGRYLKSHNKLPRYVEDLRCERHGFRCPQVGKDGAFYVVSGEQWLRMALRIKSEKLVVDCSTNYKDVLLPLQEMWVDCSYAESAGEAELLEQPERCDHASRQYEKQICASDRLMAAEGAVQNAYQNALNRSLESRKVRLISAQKQKLKHDLIACKDKACIESTLWDRYAELQRY